VRQRLAGCDQQGRGRSPERMLTQSSDHQSKSAQVTNRPRKQEAMNRIR